MKRILIRNLIIILTFLVKVLPVQAGSEQENSVLDFKLPAPEAQIQKEYLGLTNQTVFSLNQVAAQILIIEIFSMYCPICQREAADVNTLFNMIQSNPRLKDKVKMIGIGAGNSSYEVNFFKKKYNIQFPLFPDADYAIHKQIKEVRTPHFFGLNIQRNMDIEIFYSRTGEISDPKDFIDTFIRESKTGLKP